MFTSLKEQPADKILQLMQLFKEDPRDTKIDLGVGVYKNAEGVTPVMRAVKAAEKRIWEEQTTKSYVGLPGDPAFGDAQGIGVFNLLSGGFGSVPESLDPGGFSWAVVLHEFGHGCGQGACGPARLDQPYQKERMARGPVDCLLG